MRRLFLAHVDIEICDFIPAGDREIVQKPAALIDRVADWLMEQALGQTALDDLFGGCCERLLGAGIPLSRAHITFRVLHPLYEAMGMTWLRGSGVESESYIHREGDQPPEPFASSPLWHMVRTQLPFLRRSLTVMRRSSTSRCSPSYAMQERLITWPI